MPFVLEKEGMSINKQPTASNLPVGQEEMIGSGFRGLSKLTVDGGLKSPPQQSTLRKSFHLSKRKKSQTTTSAQMTERVLNRHFMVKGTEITCVQPQAAAEKTKELRKALQIES
jgi:hypothetical protein